MKRNSMNNKTKGIIYMIISSCAFSVMSLIVKISSFSADIMQQVFFRNLVGLIISYIIIKKEGLVLFAEKKYQIPLFLRSLSGYAGVVLLFKATSLGSQIDVALMYRTTPIFVSIFSFLILHEKISKVQIPAMFLCMVGAAVALNPKFDSDLLPLLLSLGCAMMSGVAYTMIAFCKGKVHPMTVIFHFCTVSTILAGIGMIPTFSWPSSSTLFMLFLIGIFAAIGQIFVTYAYQNAPSAEVSIYDYSGLVFSAFLGFIFLGESVKLSTFIGSVLIIGSGIWVFVYHKKTSA